MSCSYQGSMSKNWFSLLNTQDQQFSMFFNSRHTALYGLLFGLCLLWCLFRFPGGSSRFCSFFSSSSQRKGTDNSLLPTVALETEPHNLEEFISYFQPLHSKLLPHLWTFHRIPMCCSALIDSCCSRSVVINLSKLRVHISAKTTVRPKSNLRLYIFSFFFFLRKRYTKVQGSFNSYTKKGILASVASYSGVQSLHDPKKSSTPQS